MNLELSSHPNIKNPSTVLSKYELEKPKPLFVPSSSINISSGHDARNLRSRDPSRHASVVTPKTPGKENAEEIEGLGELSTNGGGSSRSVILYVIINILFIISFLLEYKITSTNEMNFSLQKEIDENPFYTDPNQALKDIRSLDDANAFIYNIFFVTVIFNERLYTPTNYQNTLDIDVGVNPRSSDLESDETETGYGTQYDDKSKYRFLNSFNMFKGLRLSYSYRVDSDGPLVEGSLFMGTKFNLANTLAGLDLLDEILYYQVESLKVETIFFNIIDQIGIYYEYNFAEDTSGTFEMSKKTKPFYPKTFDSDYAFPTTKALILAFRILFALTVFLQLMKILAVDIYKAAKTLFQTHKLVLPFSVLFEIILVVMFIIVMILAFLKSFQQSGTCETFGTIDEATFDVFKGYASFAFAFVRLLSVTIALLIIQILLLLNTQFPTFGILFYTLGQSKNKLLTYGLLIFTLLAGFVVVMFLNFGHGDKDMSSFGESLYLNFQFMLGSTNYSQLKEANSSLAGIYFFIFYIIFNLLILLLLVVIIMLTYVQLRRKLQLTTLALAELAGEKSNDLKKKYIKFFLCKPPEGDEDEEKGRKPKRQQQKRNLVEIILHNLEEIEWFGCSKRHQKTRDEIEDEIKQKIEEIKQRRLQKERNKITERKASLTGKLMNLIFHLIFIIIYTVTMNHELKREESFEFNQALKTYFQTQTFSSGIKTFNDLTTVDDIIDWINKIYLNSIFKDYTDESTTDTTILPVYLQNKIISSSVSRVTIRNIGIDPFRASSGDTTFYVKKPDNLKSNSGVAKHEITTKVVFNSTYTVPYQGPGALQTAMKKGGYPFALARDKENTQTLSDIFQHPKLININTGLITLQTVYMNANYDLLALCEFSIGIKSSGKVAVENKNRVFQIDIYGCDGCSGKIVLEILYLLLVLKQTYDLVQQWRQEWRKKESKKITPVKSNLKHRSWIIRFLNYDAQEWKIFPITWAVLLRCKQILDRLFVTTMMFFRKTYANLVLTASAILSFICFYYYLRILANQFRRDADLDVTPSDSLNAVLQNEEIGKFEEIAHLTETYATLQAFNSFFILIRLLFELGFSREVAFILEVIYESLFDILFFTMTFAIILIGFAVDGNLMFGAQSTDFIDIGSSFLQVLLWMISGSISDGSVDAIDTGTQAVFFIFLVVVCLLILLKMFMAIIDGQFMDLNASELSKGNLGFIQLVISLIQEKVNEEKAAPKLLVIPPNANCFQRTKLKTINFLQHVRFNVFSRIIRLVFGDDEEPTDAELARQKRAQEKNKKTVNLAFGNLAEEREAMLDDIQVYLADENKQTKLEANQEEGIEDELLKSYHWMSYLEETVYKLTGRTISLPKYGVGCKDYIKVEKQEGLDLEDKFAGFKVRWQAEHLSQKELSRRFAETVAIPEYQFNTNLGVDDTNLYQITSDHLNFLYYNNLRREQNQISDFEKLQFKLNDPILIEDEVQGDMIETEAKEEQGIKVEEEESPHFAQNEMMKQINEPHDHIFNEEDFDYSDLSLIKYWDTLSLRTQYELWAGAHKNLLTNSLRSCLWRQMKFDMESFKPFISNKTLLEKAKVGLPELEQIWQNLNTNQEEIKSDDAPILTESDVEDTSRQVKPTKRHINLIEHLIRGQTPNIIVELSKIRKMQDKMKYLSTLKHTKNDQKLMLWLLTPLNIKMEILLRIKDSTLYTFTTYLILEEIYDNIYLMDKFEAELHQDMKNKIYMFFFFFTNFEAMQRSVKKNKEEMQEEKDLNTLEYIEFLERQLQSTNHLKRKYLNKVNEILVREAPKLGSKHLTTRTEYIISESTIKSAFNYEEQDELVKSKVTEISDSGSKRTPRQKVDEDPLSPTEVLLAKKQEKLQAEEEKLKEQEATVRKLSAELDEVHDGPKSEPRIADLRKQRREMAKQSNPQHPIPEPE